MEKARVLFDGKRNGELLGMFINERFIEQFGQADIIDYLTDKPTMSYEEFMTWQDKWLKILSGSSLSDEITGKLVAETEPATHGGFTVPHNDSKAVDFLRFVSDSNIGVRVIKLCGDIRPRAERSQRFMVEFPIEGGYEYFVFGPGWPMRLKLEDIVRHLTFGRWGEENIGRETLLRIVRNIVAKERGRAVSDFDKACAISTDCKKIVVADNVIYRTGKCHGICYPASEFLRRKIQRPSDLFRPSVDKGWAKVFQEHVAHGGNTLITMQDSSKILLVEDLYFPKPLPENGVEVGFDKNGIWEKKYV